MARIFRKLAQLLDVDVVSTPPADNDSLTYDSASGKWVPEAVSGGAGGGAPTDVDYLVGTASAGLSAEIVVGTSPGGELGGTWASPTVDATHSGSSHASVQAAAEATAAAALSSHASDTTGIHGIADTSALLDTGDIGVTVQAHDADLDTYAGITPSANVQSVLGAADYAAIRTLLGLVIGTNVQAYDADLTAWAGLTPTAFFQTLVDDADAATARATLGVIASLFQNGGAQEISLAGLDGTPTDLQTHLDDTADAHDASAISIADSGGYFTGTDVEAALQELGAGDGGGTSLLFYGEITETASITNTSNSSPTTVLTSDAIVLDGSTQIEIIFTCPGLQSPGGGASRFIGIELLDALNGGAATNLGLIGQSFSSASAQVSCVASGRYVFTPASGSHVFTIGAYVNGGTGIVNAGTGGAGNYGPSSLTIRTI